MVTRCLGCAKEIPEDVEICPFCKLNFSRPLPKPAWLKRLKNSCDGNNTAPEHLLSLSPKTLLPARSPQRLQTRPRPTLLLLILAGLLILWAVKTDKSLRQELSFTIQAAAVHAQKLPLSPKPIPDISTRKLPKQRVSEVKPLRENMPVKRPVRPLNPGKEKAPVTAQKPKTESIKFPNKGTDGEEWRMSGLVFDLVALQPVSGADLVFTEATTGRRLATATDSQGRYHVYLPAIRSGYDLKISHEKYEPKYVEEDPLPLYELEESVRKEKAAKFARTIQHKQLFWAPSGSKIQKNFALIPSDPPNY